jgi:hypothetical protein
VAAIEGKYTPVVQPARRRYTARLTGPDGGGRRGTRDSHSTAAQSATHGKDGDGTMARKVVNRKELRAQAEAAEARGKTKKAAKEKPAKEKKEKAAKEPKKAAAKKPSRKKVAKVSRMKAYWGVFNPAMKRLAMFEYADKKAAEKKATELGANHFIQLIKEAIAE